MGLSDFRRYFWIAALYFASGLPYGLINDAVPVAFRQAGVDLASIGLLSLVGIAWTFKFLWSPAVERLGLRKHWASACQAGLALCFFGLAAFNPSGLSPLLWLALGCAAFFSATQDIAIDAYSIELLERRELGTANGIRVTAYRLALIAAGGLLVGLSARLGWPGVWTLAGFLFLGLSLLSLYAPDTGIRPVHGMPIWEPLKRLLAREGALPALAFILIFKVGDYAMAPMTRPFWVDRGFSAAEIGFMVGTVGMLATIAGAMLGGMLTTRWGVFRALWLLGALQALSNLGYAGAALSGGRYAVWAASILESFCGGLGTAAFLSFLMSVCEKEIATTQYALLSAFFSLGRQVSGAFSGYAAAKLGYAPYFAATFLLALPAFALLPWVKAWIRQAPGSLPD